MPPRNQCDIVARDLAHLQAALDSLYGYAGYRDVPPPSLGLADFQGDPKQGGLWSVFVRNMPLHRTRYGKGNHVNLVFVLEEQYPLVAPNGLYLSDECQHTRSVLRRLNLNAFSENAYHGARAMKNFSWVCLGFHNGWSYCRGDPQGGDSLATLLYAFYHHA
jgi:hypothetical protein